MLYRLALDIGTASCGLIAVSLDSQGEPDEIVHHGLYIFSEPLLPPKAGGVGEPKKAARRSARLARRVIDRRARRLKRIAMLAGLLGLDRNNIPSDKGQRIHTLRAEAASGRIELDDLVRVLLKLAKRRGYKGSFKVRKEKDEGVVKPGIEHLEQQMADANCTTLGQYLNKRFEAGETLKLKEAGLYSHRDMLEAEFNTMWIEQAKHHPILAESRPDPLDEQNRSRPIRNQFFYAIFFQRPLKSVAPMVGNCALEPSLPRSPMAQPAMQTFRIEKQLADLRWGMGRKAFPLSKAQRDAIREILNDPDQIPKDGKLKFEQIYKRLESVAKTPGQRDSLNMERTSREDLSGNRTLRAFNDLGLLIEWKALEEVTQLRVINFLADLGSPDQVDQPDWHKRFTKTTQIKNTKTGQWEEKRVPRELDPKLVEFINRMVGTGKFDRLNNMGFETGRASYSIRALERLAAHMREHGCDEYEAIQNCYPPPEATGELLPQLPPHSPTGNVVVDVALRQVRRAVNDALEKMGEPPAEIVIELSRDMALGIKARGEIEKKIDKNQRMRKRAREELDKHGLLPTEKNVLRYLLWEQQETHCPYCPSRISLEDAGNGNVTHFEHILPRSLTRVGKQRNHLVLAHQSCNDAKGDQTPYEAFHEKNEERWRAVEFCASVLKSNKQFAKARLLTLADYEHEVLDDESIKDFSERQFAETSWIGKLTAQWMKEICTKVSVSRGLLTAHQRRLWKLETVIAQARFDTGLPVLDTEGEKISPDDFKRFKPFWEGHIGKGVFRTDRKIDKRIDHRHHLIDALVIAQTSRSLYQRMARHYKELAERRQAGEPVRMTFSVEPPLHNVRDQALRLVQAAAIRHKPDRNLGGPFFDAKAYRVQPTEGEKSRLTRRVKLIELADKNFTLEGARKGITEIASEGTQKIVSQMFEARIGEGKTVKEALSTPIPDDRYSPRGSKQVPYKFEITHVRIFYRSGKGFFDGNKAKPINVLGRSHRRHNTDAEPRTHYKYCIDDGYAYVSLIVRNNKLISADSISVFRANLISKSGLIDDDEIRIFRGDTLLDPSNGHEMLVHQILAGGKVRVGPLTEARIWDKLRKEAGGISLSGSSLARMKRL